MCKQKNKKGRITLNESSNETAIRLKSGLTWRSFFSLIMAALLFIPINIYLNLSTGGGVGISAIYIITILLSEITRYTGKPLSKQEMFIIYSTMGTAAMAIPPYYTLISRAFFINTPTSYAYRLNGVPLPYLVPDWVSPPVGSKAYMYRTLFQLEWMKPLLVSSLFFFLHLMGDVGLSIMLSHITVNVEKLRFPFATVDASLIETITERESGRTRIFMTAFYAGLVYGALLYGAGVLPLPWIDLTGLTEKYSPGALLGISTAPGPFVFGLMLPVSTSATMLIGSMLVWVILNSLFTVNPSFFPQWVNEYYRGMTINSIYQRTFQRIWISPQFGFALGLAVALYLGLLRKSIGDIVTSRKSHTSTVRRGLRTDRSRTPYFPSFVLAILLFLTGSLGSVALFSILIPEMPLYVLLLTSLGLSLLIGTLAAYSFGETGFFTAMPWPWRAVVYLSPYQGYAAWVQPPYICTGAPGDASQTVKVSYLTETKPKDYFKAWIVAAIVNVVFGLIIVDSLWRLAPIPSSAYPNAVIQWPIEAANTALFVTRQMNLDAFLISVGTVFSFTLYFVGDVLRKIGIPFSAVSFFVGCSTLPPSAIMTLVGSLIGNYGIGRFVGKERWRAMRGVFAAGIISGVGVFLGVNISMTLISKAAWVWPY